MSECYECGEPVEFRGHAAGCSFRTYLARYSIINPWAGWLIGRAPELVAMEPTDLQQGDAAPECPRGGTWAQPKHRMVLRRGYYACYRHGEAEEDWVKVTARPDYPRAPKGDVIGTLTERRKP